MKFYNPIDAINMMTDAMTAWTNYSTLLNKQHNDFVRPMLQSALNFMQDQPGFGEDHMKMLLNKMKTFMEGATGALQSAGNYCSDKWSQEFLEALKDGALDEFFAKHSRISSYMVGEFPAAVKKIEPRVGFHFDDGGYELLTETRSERLWLIKSKKTDPGKKPVIVVGPYVLGSKVLRLLPDAGFSLVDAYVDAGIPTTVVELKDIQTEVAVQLMTPEDMVENRILFARVMSERFGQKVTYVTYCQGGFLTMCAMATGKVTEADALTTIVSPLDGSLSPGLKTYLEALPEEFRKAKYSRKKLANGNWVTNGEEMSRTYLEIAYREENFVSRFFTALAGAERCDGKINDFVSAIQCWLNDKVDLPVEIIERMSFPGYNESITPDGKLPVWIYDKQLDLNMFDKLRIKVLAVAAEFDDLVSLDSALAISKYVKGTQTKVYKTGHIGIATTHSNKAICEKREKEYIGDDGGIVDWHLSL